MIEREFIQGWTRYKPYSFNDLFSWPLFDRLKMETSIPIIGTHPTRPSDVIAWHSTPVGQNFHTTQYRLKKSICDNNLKEFSLAIEKVKNLDESISMFSNISMITLAAKFNHEQIMKTLILRGADLEVKDDTGATPLMHAISNANFDCVKLLVESGADIDNPDVYGMTPFGLAKAKNYNAISTFLKEHKESKITPKLIPFHLRIDYFSMIRIKIQMLEQLKLVRVKEPISYPFNNVKGMYLISLRNFE